MESYSGPSTGHIENPLYHAVGEYVCQCQARGLQALSEAELLSWLRGQLLVEQAALAGQGLYRVHFLMRNALYHWARAHAQWCWGFSAAGVEWRPLTGTASAQAVMMPNCSGVSGELADYYLDFANLSLSETAVDELLAGFWRQYARYAGAEGEGLAAALDTLGLTTLTDYASLKRQYRRQAMAVHPDRGGSNQALQALNQAFELACLHLPAN
ncbi:hypothetical protein L1F30_07270 [Simiduia sp. 21SJ11W-1]|uniref:DNA-J related domain-containing protein n=1 Tax=Simiduia sp. 21SJ11W-1 TaxID=2909669 RepID=UPI00209C7FFB|nr:DNA-J related domain-containing protein [Simiduia sp. 21SJ11W-1]UTA49331.1 hypothetical protein L1F30_07270 [Simiduia sp. 21SJ11W-1]